MSETQSPSPERQRRPTEGYLRTKRSSEGDSCEEESVPDTREWTDFGVDVEKDDASIVAEKLGVKVPWKTENVVLGAKELDYLNHHRDPDGNSLLMRFAEKGKSDVVEFLARCDGLELNAVNDNGKTAADIAWSRRSHSCLLKLLQSDSVFPKYLYEDDIEETETCGRDLIEFVEEREKLHECIESGDLESVENLTKSQNSSFYLNTKNKSALYRAAKKEQIKVFAFLLSLGAKFKDLKEENKCDFDEFQKDDLDVLMEEYFSKGEDSHVFKLMASSKVLGRFTDKQKAVVEALYRHLNKCKVTSLLMKVIEYEDVDVVFDFESECTNRVFHSVQGEIYGLTVPKNSRIYIGAKKCETEKTFHRNVAGTLAHELCHLALEVLYGNWAMPYKKEDVGKRTTFDLIVRDIEGRLGDVDEVIRLVFDYRRDKWHSELIVRVPHILALYGETEGRRLLRKQVPELFKYYLKNIVPACENYSKEAFFMKPLCLIQPLQKYYGCIEEMESNVFKEPLRSFQDFLNPHSNISILTTCNTKLCCFHVYHELRGIYQFHLEKRCLFIELQCFKENYEIILNAFKCRACNYLVLFTNDKCPDFRDLSFYFHDIARGEEKKVILIVSESCENLDPNWKKRVLRYEWNDLCDSFRRVLLEKKIVYQGEENRLEKLTGETPASRLINPEGLSYLVTNDIIHIGDGRHLASSGYNEKFFIERFFVRQTANKVIRNGEKGSYHLFLTGLSLEKLEELGIDVRTVQMVGNLDSELDEEKRILLPRQEKGHKTVFDKLGVNASVHWLHFIKGDFYWRRSKGNDRMIVENLETDLLSEIQLIESSDQRKDRVILIADDPGTGKSTVSTDLLRKIKKKWPEVWVGRVNFNEYADSANNPLSLENIQTNGDSKDVIAYFLKILRLQNPLELKLVETFLHIPVKSKIIFDGFDEISPYYKDKALVLLKNLKNKTNIQMWITTRNHEREDLEIELDVSSWRMRPCTSEDQARYLDGIWKHELKSCVEISEEGFVGVLEKIGDKIGAILSEMEQSLEGHNDLKAIESLKSLKESIECEEETNYAEFKKKVGILKSRIDKLDFISYARVFLDGVSFSIKDEEKLFTGSPLHLFMLASVSYHDNLKIQRHSDIFHLYSNFVNKKIEIFVKEKCRNTQETQGNIDVYRNLKKEMLNGHRKIAKCVIQSENVSWQSIKDSDVMEYIHRVGLVTKFDESFHFIHRTFAEYFFSEWVLERIRCGTQEEEVLNEVLLNRNYGVVRRFLDSAFQSEENEVDFTTEFIIEYDVKWVFRNFILQTENEDLCQCMHLWKRLISKLEEIKRWHTVDRFIFDVRKTSDLVSPAKKMKVFQLVRFCLSDELLLKLFDSRCTYVEEFLYLLISRERLENVLEVLRFMKKVLCQKAYHSSQANELDSSLQENMEDVDGLFQNLRDSNVVGETMRMLKDTDDRGKNIFHCACTNGDAKVFGIVVAFLKSILGEELLSEHLTKIDVVGRSVLHHCALYEASNIMEILNEVRSNLEARSYTELVKGANRRGENFLHDLTQKCGGDELKQVLVHLSDAIGPELLNKMIYERNYEGSNILSRAAPKSDIRAFADILEAAKRCKGDEEFPELEMMTDKKGATVFHWRAGSGHFLRDLKILENFIGEGRMKELLTKVDDFGETCLHDSVRRFLCGRGDHECVVDDIRFISEVLDVDSLEEFVLRANRRGNTFLHLLANSDLLVDCYDIVCAVKYVLSEDCFQRLLDVQNENSVKFSVEYF